MKWLINTPLMLTFLAVPAVACAEPRPARVAYGYQVEAPHYSADAWRDRADFRRDARDGQRADFRRDGGDANRGDFRRDGRDARPHGDEARRTSSQSGRRDARPAAPHQRDSRGR